MPRLNFSTVGDVDDFTPVEEDTYLCRLENVEEASTQFGDPLWKLRWIIAQGPNKGRIVFDNVAFSAAALKRVKLLCNSLGLDVSGEVDLTPEMLTDRTCLVTVDIEEYQDNQGNTKRTNVVPFAGYEPAPVRSTDAGDDTPF